MTLQITGKIEVVYDKIARTAQNGATFFRREFVLYCTRYNPENGEPWENHPKFELTGDKCDMIDNFKIGQRVTVDFSLKGAKYSVEETGEIKFFTTINAYRVTSAEQNGDERSQASVQQPAAQSPSQAHQQGQPVSSQGDANEQQGDSDDLPF